MSFRRLTNWGARALLCCAALVLAQPGCNPEPDRECEDDDEHCSGSIAMQCGSKPNYYGVARYWRRVPCAGPEFCQVRQHRAFCSIEPGPNPTCEMGLICDGSFKYVCSGPIADQREYCVDCPADGGLCKSGLGSQCNDAHKPCPSGLVCPSGSCKGPCACDDGTLCPSCEQWGAYGDSDWICNQGLCERKRR